VSDLGTTPAARVPGMEFGAAPSGQPRPLHRLERNRAPAQHWLGGLQHALSDPALDSGPASGLAYFGTDGRPVVARLGGDVRSSGLFRGDLHRSRPLSGNLLPRRQLAVFGNDYRARQGFHEQTPQPLL